MSCWLIKVSVRNFMFRFNNIQLMTLRTFSRKVGKITGKKEQWPYFHLWPYGIFYSSDVGFCQ